MGGTNGEKSDDFAELLAAQQTRLFGYIYAMIPNMADAEDVYQDTVIALWRKFHEYQPGTNFVAWARAMARFEIQHYFRSKSRCRVHFDEKMLAELTETQARLESADTASSLESYTPALLRCMDKLPESDCRLIKLCYAMQSNLTQTAKQLGRSPQSVCNSLGRIRRTLFDCIRQVSQVEEQ